MPDVFHGMHDLVKRYSFVMGQRVRHAHQELTKAQEALARRPGRPQPEAADAAAKALGETRQAEVTRWEEGHNTSRDHVATLSLTLHPFRIADSAPQTSAQVESQLQA